MRRTKLLLATIALCATIAAGLASAGQWPYIQTFYDEAGNAVGWQVGGCDGRVSYYGQRTDDYTIERLFCRD